MFRPRDELLMDLMHTEGAVAQGRTVSLALRTRNKAWQCLRYVLVPFKDQQRRLKHRGLFFLSAVLFARKLRALGEGIWRESTLERENFESWIRRRDGGGWVELIHVHTLIASWHPSLQVSRSQIYLGRWKGPLAIFSICTFEIQVWKITIFEEVNGGIRLWYDQEGFVLWNESIITMFS